MGVPGPVHVFLVWVGQTPVLFELMNFMAPSGETLIGLGLVVGAAVRPVVVGGASPMTLFYLGNTEWGHGFINDNLLGLVMFLMVGVLAAGCILDPDAYLEETGFVHQQLELQYFLDRGGVPVAFGYRFFRTAFPKIPAS